MDSFVTGALINQRYATSLQRSIHDLADQCAPILCPLRSLPMSLCSVRSRPAFLHEWFSESMAQNFFIPGHEYI